MVIIYDVHMVISIILQELYNRQERQNWKECDHSKQRSKYFCKVVSSFPPSPAPPFSEIPLEGRG